MSVGWGFGLIVMDLNRARIFVHVVDCGTISAAAVSVKRTQQAISNQLQILEKELGIILMDRQGPKLVLTKSGEHLYSVFKQKIAEIDASVAAFRADENRAEGVIRIGLGDEFFDGFLSELVNGFCEKYPKVSFDFKVGTDVSSEEMLVSNTLDLSFQLFTKDKRLFRCTPIYSQTFVPVVSKVFIEKYSMPGTLEETLKMPVLDYSLQFGLYHHWIKKNDRKLVPAMERKAIRVAITHMPTLKKMVMQGIGIGFLIEDIIQDELKSGELIALPMNQDTSLIRAELDMVYKRKSGLGFVQQEFVNYVIQKMN